MTKWLLLSLSKANGRILLLNGGVIPGVGVEAENVATGVDLATITNESGNYLFDHLNPGEYALTASLPGFKTTWRLVDLRTGDKLTIDFTMQVGEVTDQVTVEAATPLLQSASGDLDSLLDNRNVELIPLAQGNPTYLITLAPRASASAGYGWKYDEPGWTITTGFTFHGVAGNQLGYFLNGINNTSSIFGSGAQAMAQPPTEAVEEVKISEGYDDGRHTQVGDQRVSRVGLRILAQQRLERGCLLRQSGGIRETCLDVARP